MQLKKKVLTERERERKISGLFRVDASDFKASANYLYSTNHRWFSKGISYSVDRDENHQMPAQTTKTWTCTKMTRHNRFEKMRAAFGFIQSQFLFGGIVCIRFIFGFFVCLFCNLAVQFLSWIFFPWIVGCYCHVIFRLYFNEISFCHSRF